MSKPEIDYSLYLVTARELLPPGKDYYESLEESLRGGVTVVQVREKDVDTGEIVEVARRTKEICDKYAVPLIINDRVDVALAVGSAGVHLGQSDLPLPIARRLLPPNTIIGVSVRNVEETRRAIAEGADYVGIGAVWDTSSKDLKGKIPLGPEGVGEILDELVGTGVKAVAIGGIHLPNLPHLLHGSISPTNSIPLDGIALISDIVASPTPELAARDLRLVLDSFYRVQVVAGQGMGKSVCTYIPSFRMGNGRSAAGLIEKTVELMSVVRETTPLAHQMTNNVVMNDSANVTLALGASPIMATHPKDVLDLSKIIGGLLINFGTISDKEGMIVAGKAANVNRKPLVFDPVAVGATSYRKDTARELLHAWQPTVIKGNPAEIGSLAESVEVASRGVDAVGSGFADPAAIVRALARKKRCIIAMTGKHDYISDGDVVVKLSNGHDYLESITGSGCMTGTCVTIFTAAARLAALDDSPPYEEESQLVHGDMLAGTVAGMLAYTIAGEIAAQREDVKGTGTFRAALIDELYNLKPEMVQKMAKVEILS